MKRYTLVLILLISTLGFAQEEENSESVKIHQNEISFNVLELILIEAVELQYERYLPKNQALQFNLTLFDSYGYWEAGSIEKSSAHSILAAYKFYMGKRDHHGVFFYPYMKYMFGSLEHTESNWFTDQENEIIDVDNFSLGFGFGYKWLFADKFTLGVDFNLGRTFNNDLAEFYSSIEYKSGLSFGMRF